ncbi:hypothetical protein K474DRAFT_1605174 [Panus rudis PR-1116 ss-1]|nr:hypothetical protein K474DRAFT_1605174 [Panus rudis PR-1116 ss-1]
MAHQYLSQSLSSMPKTPPKPSAPATDGRGRSQRIASSHYPSSSSAQPDGQKTAPGALGRTRSSTNAAYVSAGGKSSGVQAGEASGGMPGSVGKTSSSLRVLKGCNIFVDVRTDDGDDAGSLFADMLQDMGAKIPTRVGQTCTHIVYKNGLMSTLTRYRLLHEPKPKVVGIAWVVECVEKGAHVDETKFLIDLEGVNVAGTNKRRKSMLPKHLLNSPAPAGISPTNSIGEGSSRKVPTDDRSSSPSEDNSPAGNSSLDSLPPLERARRRQSTLVTRFGFGPQK